MQPRLNTTHYHGSHNVAPEQRVDNETSPKRSTVSHGECTAASVSDVHDSHRHLQCVATENSLLTPPPRKRPLSTRSPYKTPRSPIPKFKRRARTGMEINSVVSLSSPNQIPVSLSSTSRQRIPDMQIKLSSSERSAILQLQKEMDIYTLFNYILSKDGTSAADASILSIQDYMTVVCPVTVQKANIVYMQVLDANKDTLMTIMFDLHQRFIERQASLNCGC